MAVTRALFDSFGSTSEAGGKMDVSRQLAGRVVTALYAGGGLLLLKDFLNAPSTAEAHLPMAWHVFPLSWLVSLAAAIAEVSAPLDPIWHVSIPVMVVSYLCALTACSAAVMRVVAGSGARDGATDGELGMGSDEAD
jgi:hypothetical protein